MRRKSGSRQVSIAAPVDADAILADLDSLRSERNIRGMARFGIRPARPLGISVAQLRKIARRIPRDHALAQALWASGIHEARILAGIVAEPERLSVRQMNAWARDFDSWDVCDQCCLNLFGRTPHAWGRAEVWSRRKAEFVKRAGFALVAVLAVHDRRTDVARFLKALDWTEREATDPRRFVSKAVNWALRQIGKRNETLCQAAVATARRIARLDSRAARWVASDALRELVGTRVGA